MAANSLWKLLFVNGDFLDEEDVYKTLEWV